MTRIALVMLAAGSLAPPARADVADVAELFPAGTLAYAEVGDPAAAARVAAGWVKGTPFEDGLRLAHDRKDAIKDYKGVAGQGPAGLANLLASPEFLREVGRFRGAAAGLTGFTDKNEPQAALAVLFGDSAAGGLLARGFLTTGRDLRRIDTVDGVPVFQHRAFPAMAYGNDGKPLPFENPKPTEGRCEPTYAYRPGLFVVGTNKAAVADVLARFAGKAAGPSLAASPAFRRFADDRMKPGAFVFAAPPALAAELERVRKADREAVNGDALAVLNFVANPKAVPVVAGNLAVGGDELVLAVRGEVAAGQSSPLLALLAGSGGPRVPVPAEAVGALTLTLPRPADRVKALLGLADAWAKAGGRLGALPSDQVADAEKRTGLDVRDGVLRRVAAATLVLPQRQELPAGVSPHPLLALHTAAAADTEALAAAVPKLVALTAGAEKPSDPAAETIQGVRVLSLPGTGLPQAAPVHYAAGGAVLVIGLDRKWVARLAADAGKNAAGASAAAIDGTVRLGPLVRIAGAAIPAAADRTRPNAVPVPPAKPGEPAETAPPGSAALAAALDVLPPAALRVGVGPDGFRAELAVRGFRAKLPGLAEKLVRWLEQVGAEANPGEMGHIPRGLLDR